MGGSKTMNNRGELVARDLIFMILILSSIVIFASIFVEEMAVTYGNDELISEFVESGLVTNTTKSFGSTRGTMKDMANSTEGGIGEFSEGEGEVGGMGDVLKMLFRIPIIFRDLLSGMLQALKIPKSVANPIGTLLIGVILILLTFTIASAFLKGGKV